MKLVWFLNNLRSHDNQALTRACAAEHGDEPVIALYCFDPQFFSSDPFGFPRTGKFRAQFLLESLEDLQQQLTDLNIPLLIRVGAPAQIIPELVAEHGVTELFLQREWTRDERAALASLRAAPAMDAVHFHTDYDQFLIHPDDLPFAEVTELPEVFTQFRQVVEQQLPIRSPLPTPKARLARNLTAAGGSSPLPTLEALGLEQPAADPRSAFPFLGGSSAGKQRIEDYFWRSENITRYKHTRNGLIGTEYSSKLSAWLANGSLSAREVYAELKRFEREIRANEDTYWLHFELLWRDYFKYISLKHGDRLFALGGIRAREYQWQLDPEKLAAWIDGRTPYDFVNANMREFAATGWMSNRGRQNVASYWAKELQQDWRAGAAWFESQLIDYDVHSNYGNWMYNSGVGNDPRDRRFNIGRQAENYDPDKLYRKLWLGN
ncbi:deoxyribodipyrimidine photolyase [Microbulbifer agarilyticus]|uniref:Cryptochrome DASH n=1 Tax=Microbulbifer agarilyticus TaxID=260552 RepID=A0A1Q2M0Z4_9GAMM|nr:DASH family cryptochrome [Microbulbifer agarilyticus]AQQ66381.1 deoxyribodipyrimidine photolyase [Microbulbifer agarilyticus]